MSKDKQIYVSFYEDSDFFAEEIYNPSLTPQTQFILLDKARDSINIVFDFEANLNGTTQKISPINSSLIDNKIILFPSSIDNTTTGENLDKKILLFIHRWLDIEEFSEQLCLAYIKMTWIYDRLSVVPYLRAIGDYGSGKTRFIQTIGSLCYKPMFLAGATSDAYLFRVIELFKGTMVVNELERVNTDLNSQIVNILNNGYEKGMGIGRIEGDRVKTPVVYDVFCPKVISAREPFKDLALESRIITNRLYATSRNDIPFALDDSFWSEAEKIRNALLGYRFKYIESQTRRDADPQINQSNGGVAGLAGLSLNGSKKQVLNDLEPRLRQTMFPLLFVIPEDKMQSFINFTKDYQKEAIEDRGFELEGICVKALFQLLETQEEVSIKDLRAKINEELDSDKFKITPQKLGKILKSLGLKTKPVGHEKISCIIKNETSLNRLRIRFGISDTPQSPVDTADPQHKDNSMGGGETNDEETKG